MLKTIFSFTKSPTRGEGTTQPNRAPQIESSDQFQDPMNLLRNPHYTKSSAFTDKERVTYGLQGLLPSAVETLHTQVLRAYTHFKTFSDPLAKYIYLSSLRERNETLFYMLAKEHLEEVLPYIYTPTVGLACQKFGQLFRQSEGLYIDMFDDVSVVLKNWKPGLFDKQHTSPNIIVLTDGSRILGLGDLGINGMGIPIGKLALYVAVGGFAPLGILPICLDVGTDNNDLLADPLYMGLRNRRPDYKTYMSFIDRVMKAINKEWPHSVVQFEDIQNKYCFDILDTYRSKYRCFNDDIQGTGVVTAAGLLSALKLVNIKKGIKWNQHKFLFLGCGSASVGVAHQIVNCLKAVNGCTTEEARDLFYMVDSKGLLSFARPEESIAEYKKPFCRGADEEIPHNGSLLECVRQLKPTTLIGLSGQPQTFTQEICTLMAEINEDPIIFSLSNPTSKSECTFSQAMEWTDGRVIWAAGSPMEDVGDRVSPQGNNLWAFPGIGFGGWLGQVKYFTDDIMTAASLALVDATTIQRLEDYQLYPPMEDITKISDIVSCAVIECAQKLGLCEAKDLPNDHEDLLLFVKSARYAPGYVEWDTDAEAEHQTCSKIRKRNEYQSASIIGNSPGAIV